LFEKQTKRGNQTLTRVVSIRSQYGSAKFPRFWLENVQMSLGNLAEQIGMRVAFGDWQIEQKGRTSSCRRGDKDKYTDKHKRKAEHIEEGYKERGVSEEEAERRAWATVNAMHHGGEKPGGGGYGKPENKEPARKGGRKGGSR
jgi:hypothetical protein